jgi:hypothetical protein
VGKLPYDGKDQGVGGQHHVLGASRRQVHEHTRSQNNKENYHVREEGDVHFTTGNSYFRRGSAKIRVKIRSVN